MRVAKYGSSGEGGVWNTIKLLVLDVDGTILLPDGSVSERLKRDLLAADRQGVAVALATSRRLWATQAIAAALPIRPLLVLCDGAVAVSADERTILHVDQMQAASVSDAVRHAGDGDRYIIIDRVVDGRIGVWGPREADAIIDVFERECGPVIERKDRAQLIAAGPALRVTVLGPGRALQALAENWRRDDVRLLEYGKAQGGFGLAELHVLSPTANKASATQSLAAHLGISMEEVVAVGDGINDRELLMAVGVGVAMGNAVDEILRVADHVVADLVHDGAAEAIERHVLTS